MMKSMGMATGLPLPASPVSPASNVTLWDATTGQQLRALPASPNSFMQFGNNPVALSLDGRTLAAPDGATRIKLWDVSTGKENRSLPVDRALRTSAVGWSPDGRLLASGTWETKAGVNFANQSTMDSFSFDSSFAHTVRVWDTETGQRSYKLQRTTIPSARSPSAPTENYSPRERRQRHQAVDSRWSSVVSSHRNTWASRRSTSAMTKAARPQERRRSTRLWNTSGGELSLRSSR